MSANSGLLRTQTATLKSLLRVAVMGKSSLLSEEEFLRALCQERKRAERTARPFVLMLLECRNGSGQNGLQAKLTKALSGCTRETDTTGWYAKGATLGVIFTEVADNRNATLQSIRSRFTAALGTRLSAAEMKAVQFSLHVFPADGADSTGENEAKWYRDLAPGDQRKMPARILKRAIDVVGSLAALALFSPLLLAICVGIKLTSKGPILYKQKRVGRYGRVFTFLKFRSMQPNADASLHREFVLEFIKGTAGLARPDGNGGCVYKITDDPRITKLGRWLRKTSLDELPQFLNVLAGQMSLVGPRPPLPYEYEQYSVWHRRRVSEAKPGLTGLWQVSARSTITFDEMVRLDLQYVQQCSMWTDLKILFLTPRAVINGHGAY